MSSSTDTPNLKEEKKLPEQSELQKKIQGLRTEHEKLEIYKEMKLKNIVKYIYIIDKINKEDLIELITNKKKECIKENGKDDIDLLYADLILAEQYRRGKQYGEMIPLLEGALRNKNIKKIDYQGYLEIWKDLYILYKGKNEKAAKFYYDNYVKMLSQSTKDYIEYVRSEKDIEQFISDEKEISSLERDLKTNLSDDHKIGTLHRLCWAYISKGDKQKGEKYFKKFEKIQNKVHKRKIKNLQKATIKDI